MRRRSFVAGAASGVLVMRAPAAWAQVPGRPRRVAVLMGAASSPKDIEVRLTALRQGLRKAGWTEGNNVQLDIRHAQGEPQRMRGQAKELLALKPDVIVAHAPQVLEAVRAEAGSVPIVFVQVPFPVEMGIVKSLSHPGGNATGVTIFEAAIAGKWLEILTEMAPQTERALVLTNGNNSAHRQFIDVLEAAAPRRKVTLHLADGSDLERAEQQIRLTAAQPGAGLLVLPDLFMSVNRQRFRLLIDRLRLPTIYPFRYYAEEGGLVSYSPELDWMFGKAAFYIDRILRGTHPSELPVEAPNIFTLIINLKTAKALGIEVPIQLLVRADEVIE